MIRIVRTGEPAPVETSKVYLGDAVYAADTPGRGLALTTEDGYRATNTIILEPEVLAALVEFARARGYRLGDDPKEST